MAINYCSIKVQIVIILRKILICTFSEHITNFRTLSIDKTNKTKNGELFFCKLFRIWWFLILLRKANLELKVGSTNRNSPAFLLHNSKTFFNFEVFLIFFTNCFGTNFRHQNKYNFGKTISCFVYQLSKKILHILCVWTLKILYTNKRILLKNTFLNIVLPC